LSTKWLFKYQIMFLVPSTKITIFSPTKLDQNLVS